MERADATVSSEPSVVPIEPDIRWDRGASLEFILSSGGRTVVGYYASFPDSLARREGDAWVGGVVQVITFEGCYSVTSSSHGWEQRGEHQLSQYGLKRLRGAFTIEVIGSPMVQEFTGYRGQAPLRHFGLLFQDTTVELLAESLAFSSTEGSVTEVMAEVVSNWD